MMRRPPELAEWMVRRFGCATDNEAVTGDLAERYRQGKSARWYWRQVCVAIVVGAFNDIRTHKLITLRAMIVGWPIFWYLGFWVFNFEGMATQHWPPDWLYSTIQSRYPWLYSWSIWPAPERFTAFYWYCENALGSMLMFLIGAVPGWVLARLNPRRRRAILLLFSLSVLLSWIYYRLGASAQDIGGSFYWEAYFWVNTIIQVLGVLAGGLFEFPSNYQGSLRRKWRTIAHSTRLVGLLAALFGIAFVSRSLLITAQDSSLGTIKGIVTLEGTAEPIADVRITVVAKGSLAATGFTAQQILNAAARGAAVNPELVQVAQEATRGGPGAARATAPPLTAISDSSGRFSFGNVSPGEYSVRAELQGYFGDESNGIRPPIASAAATVARQQTVETHLTLIRGATISGRVLDPNGKPLQNAPVQALQTVYDEGMLAPQIANVKPTDDRGEFRLGVLSPGEYYLAVVPPPGTRAPAAGEAAVSTLYSGALDLSTAAPVVLHGGEDLSGMNLQVKTAAAAKITGRVVHTLPEGPAPGGRGGGRPLIATIALAPRYSSALPVVIANGGVISANPDGSFEIPNVPPGSYDLFARLPIAQGWGSLAPPERATAPWALGRSSLEVSGGDIDNVSVIVHQGSDVKGRLMVDGQAASSNVRISLAPDGSGGRVYDNQISQVFRQIAQYPVQIAQDGSFTIPVVPEGHYRFQIALSGPLAPNAYVVDIRQGGVSVYDNGLSVGSGTVNPIEVDVNTNGGSIEGAVLGVERKPVPNTIVVAVPTPSRRQNPALYKTVQTDAQGRFTMTGIAPGAWKLFAWKSVPLGAYQNAEFMRRFEERGAAVAVTKGSRTDAEITLIR